VSAIFSSLKVFNYRLWFAGALVSNTGAWMQRTAQDWIVLTELTDQDAAAVGITMALQFGPMMLLMPVAGLMADRFDRRRLMMWTQGAQCVLAVGLGILVLFGHAQLWHVYVFALLLGVATALDGPSRQAFASELVADAQLQNAVALNSTSFQVARVIGPAVAGVLIALIGTGPVFLVNALSFAGVLLSLGFIRTHQLVPSPRLAKGSGQIREGFAYVRSRPDIVVVLVMVSIVGTFGFCFPIFIATMSTIEFGKGATEFGLLSSAMAAGAVVGALLAARRDRPRLGVVVIASAAFGIACAVAALAPSYVSFACALIIVGACSITMMSTANAYVQTQTAAAMRGRVMALYFAIFAGGTPIGAPIVGWAANMLGPRWAMGFGVLSGLVAAAIAGVWLLRTRASHAPANGELGNRQVDHPSETNGPGPGQLMVRREENLRRDEHERLGTRRHTERVGAGHPRPVRSEFTADNRAHREHDAHDHVRTEDQTEH
jgi:MFS family permease